MLLLTNEIDHQYHVSNSNARHNRSGAAVIDRLPSSIFYNEYFCRPYIRVVK